MPLHEEPDGAHDQPDASVCHVVLPLFLPGKVVVDQDPSAVSDVSHFCGTFNLLVGPVEIHGKAEEAHRPSEDFVSDRSAASSVEMGILRATRIDRSEYEVLVDRCEVQVSDLDEHI
jgi:hypothetical protein